MTHDTATGAVTDLLSMYYLPASNLGCAKHTDLQSMYVFYVVPGRHSMVQLLSDATALAKQVRECGCVVLCLLCVGSFHFFSWTPLQAGADVLNMLDVMRCRVAGKELKFHEGTGVLHYYLYNWKCPSIIPDDLALLLL